MGKACILRRAWFSHARTQNAPEAVSPEPGGFRNRTVRSIGSRAAGARTTGGASEALGRA